MKRVFFIECSGPIWRSVAAECATMSGWMPVLWTGSYLDRDAVAQAFPAAVFLAGPDAALGLPDAESPWPLPPLEPLLLQAMAPAESIALHMMDRMDAGGGAGFTHDARRRHYHRLLRYWAGALERLKPDLIVLSIAPHVVFDYVLYALACHLGVPTVMFERFGLPGWVFPMARFEQGSGILRSHLQDTPGMAVDAVPEPFGRWLRDSMGGKAVVPANFQKKLQRYRLSAGADQPPMLRAVLRELKRAAILVRRYGWRPPPNSYLRSTSYPHDRAGPVEALVSRLRGIMAKRRLMAWHDALTAVPQAGENYVFLALHYQPERATVPMGGQFGDQTLIVDLLARTLPADWKLYVKEHPWQLQPFGRGEVQRSKAFYAAITGYPNVVLLPRDSDTGELVRGARAVATVTGSVGWDALCAGIPVLLFGGAWYRDCPGVIEVTSGAALVEAWTRIAAGVRPAAEGIAAFCHALSRVCVPGILEPELEQVDHVDVAGAAKAMAQALTGHAEEPVGR